jgi:hypothetical protein
MLPFYTLCPREGFSKTQKVYHTEVMGANIYQRREGKETCG